MAYLRRAFDFIEAADLAPTEDALQEQLASTLQQFSATQFALIGVASQANGARLPVALSRGTKREWSERYLARGYFNADPVVHTAIRRSTPFTWDDFHTRDFSVTARTVFNEGRDTLKVDASLVVPTHDAKGFAGLISLFFAEGAPDIGMRKALRMIALYGLERAKELRGLLPDGGRDATPCTLTARQRESLAFMAMGKTDWEIGSILGVASRTVEHHLNAAKREMGVATRAQAAAIAVHRGWIAL